MNHLGMIQGRVWAGALLFFACNFAVGSSVGNDSIGALQKQFFAQHRVFKKVISGQSSWESAFCHGVYEYQLLLQTQVQEVQIDLQSDGSVLVEAQLEKPYVGFQGNYQGAYSFCFPVGAWSGVQVTHAKIRARVDFFDLEDGRVKVKVSVDDIYLGDLLTSFLAPSVEKKITETINQGLKELWASELGDWLNIWISECLNQNIPIHL